MIERGFAMNGRLKEIYERVVIETADKQDYTMRLFLKRFSELIVRECASVVLNDAWTDWDEAPSELKAQNIKIAAKLLEHFGIKE